MFQPLPIAQVKAGKRSQNFINEIRKMMYSLHQEKEVTKEVCNNIMNLIKL